MPFGGKPDLNNFNNSNNKTNFIIIIIYNHFRLVSCFKFNLFFSLGFKVSGHGREGGADGLTAFCEVKSVVIDLPNL